MLLQRLSQIIRTLAQFPEQTRVLNGDNRLSGEIAQQLNLLVAERPDLLSIDPDCADQLGVLKHRYNDNCPSPCEIR